MSQSETDDLAGRTWAKVSDALDRQLAPLGLHAISSLAPRNGEHVVDVGCGAGQTCIQLASAVGSSGSVLGVDISPALIATAIQRTELMPMVQIAQGDAQTFSFRANAFDAIYSRFGVMAFRNPVATFKNLRRALKPDGRISFVCWRRLEENDLDNIPLRAALPVLPKRLSTSLEQTAPFSLAEPTQARRTLANAGFQNIQISPYDKAVSSGDMESMLELALEVGPLGKILRENPEFRERASEPVRRALELHDGPDGVALNAAVWIVTGDAG